MEKITPPAATSSPLWEQLEQHARGKIQEFVQALLEEEVEELLGRKKSERRQPGSRVGYRNGLGKARQLTLTNGTITLRRPRVRDLDARFESRVLPLFQRRSEALGALLPELYLHGLALGDFELAFRGLLGEGAALSPSAMQRLTATWQAQYAGWRQRDLSELDLVYLWADGLYVKAGLEATKAALLVLIGGLADGRKVVLAVESGERESTASWAGVLRDLKQRGLRAPQLTIADGHLGIWGGLGQVYPTSAEQRCWNHKLRNVLDAVPLKAQDEVKAALQALPQAPTRREAERGRRAFRLAYATRFPKAVERLERDWDRMVSYYAFPQEHWRHLRTTNVVESPFASVRLRTSAAKRYRRVDHATAMIWRLLLVAERQFRKLNAPTRCREVHAGKRFVDGKPVKPVAPAEKTRKDYAA